MRTNTTRIFATVATGIVGVALAVFGVKQCSDKKTALYERDVAKDTATVLEDRKEKNIALTDSLQQSRSVVDSLTKVVAARDDEVLQLRDALEVATKNLNDCESNKKKATTKKSAKRSTTTKTKSDAKPTTIVKQNVGVCKGAGEKSTKVQGDANVPATVVEQNTTPATNANATGVTIGNGSHSNTVNINNGTINNYYAPVDTVKKKCASASQTIIVKRVYTRQK